MYNEETGELYDGRRHEDNSRKYELIELQSIHKEIIRRLVLGQKPANIAKALGLSHNMVSSVRNSSITRKHLEMLEEKADGDVVTIKKRIRAIAPKALLLLENILNGVDDDGSILDLTIMQQAKVAQDLLDRGGFGKMVKMEADVTVNSKADSDWVSALAEAADSIRSTDESEDESEDENSEDENGTSFDDKL